MKTEFKLGRQNIHFFWKWKGEIECSVEEFHTLNHFGKVGRDCEQLFIVNSLTTKWKLMIFLRNIILSSHSRLEDTNSVLVFSSSLTKKQYLTELKKPHRVVKSTYKIYDLCISKSNNCDTIISFAETFRIWDLLLATENKKQVFNLLKVIKKNTRSTSRRESKQLKNGSGWNYKKIFLLLLL